VNRVLEVGVDLEVSAKENFVDIEFKKGSKDLLILLRNIIALSILI